MILLLTIGFAALFSAGRHYERKNYWHCLLGVLVAMYFITAGIGKLTT